MIPPLKKGDTLYYKPIEKATIFNEKFIESLAIPGIDDEVPEVNIVDMSIPPLHITPYTVEAIIKKLDPNKAAGPDHIHNKILINAKEHISNPLSILFNRSIAESKFPKEWKKAHVTPVLKKRRQT